MSDIGSMVAELIEAGCAPAVAAKVVAQAFTAGVASADFRVTSRDESAERRREKDRIRQQNRRDNLRKSADLRDNPQMSQNASLSKERKKEEIKEERGARSVTSRGRRLPDDWQPSAPDLATASELIGDRLALELEKFRDHWKQQPGSKGVKLDWDAAWRNWYRRAAEFGGKQNGHRNGSLQPHSGADQSRSTSIIAGVAAAAQRRFGGGGQGTVSVTPEPPGDDDSFAF